jgi:acyl-CoA thioesterase
VTRGGQASADTREAQGTLVDLLETLDLEQVEVDLYRGRSAQTSLQRVFGGQVACQSLGAAGWLLYDEQPPSASGGRDRATGRILDADGHLVASVVQDGLIPPAALDDRLAAALAVSGRWWPW